MSDSGLAAPNSSLVEMAQHCFPTEDAVHEICYSLPFGASRPGLELPLLEGLAIPCSPETCGLTGQLRTLDVPFVTFLVVWGILVGITRAIFSFLVQQTQDKVFEGHTQTVPTRQGFASSVPHPHSLLGWAPSKSGPSQLDATRARDPRSWWLGRDTASASYDPVSTQESGTSSSKDPRALIRWNFGGA